jgi:gephyrin
LTIDIYKIKMSTLRAAILVVSETAAANASTDQCIPALQHVFQDKGRDQWATAETRIVPDRVLDIQQTITQWTDGPEPVHLIVTSGGTGFAEKDVTPEVSEAFIPSLVLQHSTDHHFRL